MNTFKRVSLFLFALAVGCFTRANSSLLAEDAADANVAAIVNGNEIKVSEIDQVMKSKPAFAMYQTMGNKSPEMLNKLRVSVLNNMVDRRLLLDAAADSHLVEGADLQKRTTEVIERYGGEAKLKEILKTSGVTYEQFLTDLQDDFKINSYLEKSLLKDVEITDGDLKAVFDSSPERFAQREEVRARHILIKTPKDANSEAEQAGRKKIEEIYAQVIAPNADFGEIAKAKSECPSAPRGGDLGFFPRGAMVPQFEQAAFSMKPGEISKPLKTDFGFHIIKVEERHEAAEPDFEKAKARIKTEIMHKKRAELLETRVKELRSKAKVEIKLKG